MDDSINQFSVAVQGSVAFGFVGFKHHMQTFFGGERPVPFSFSNREISTMGCF
jgi:hypothetical protein